MISGEEPQKNEAEEPAADTGADATPVPPTEATPTLNRAARRAQAQHKASGAGNKPGFQGGKASGFTPRGGATPNKARIPRTGHK